MQWFRVDLKTFLGLAMPMLWLYNSKLKVYNDFYISITKFLEFPSDPGLLIAENMCFTHSDYSPVAMA